MAILDCTLRDGGYYSNWDFDRNLVDNYLKYLNDLPIDYIEVGYRSKTEADYYGEYYYCPKFRLNQIRQISNKKLSVMINEKSVTEGDIDHLFGDLNGIIDLVRIATNPNRIKESLLLANCLKKLGFEVGLNIMYMSKWIGEEEPFRTFSELQEIPDFVTFVDSYGSVYPQEVAVFFKSFNRNKKNKLGFHGHNNIEMGLVNSLTSIENGADIVDCTILGMGRGAGNLKTELLLTTLSSKGILNFDFNILTKVVDLFSKLFEKYQWGTNLPYMVSGANSLPQKDVMEWVSKRYYSYNSIIQALANMTKGVEDNLNLIEYTFPNKYNTIFVIGGGQSASVHSNSINEYIKRNPDSCIIHTSSKNANSFKDLSIKQYHCLVGNEGYRLESKFDNLNFENRIAILPPYPRTMGTYVPKKIQEKAFQIKGVEFTDRYKESVTALALQAALNMSPKILYFAGYDGYTDRISEMEAELFIENEYIFKRLTSTKVMFYSLTPTKYSIPVVSIYSLLL